MKWRSSLLHLAVILACGWSGGPAFAGQSALAEAQHDYNAGRYNRAVDALNAAIAKSPEDASLQFLLGQSYYQLGEFPRASASFERAVQLAPKDSVYRDWLAKAYGRRAEESMFLNAMTWARKTHRGIRDCGRTEPRKFRGAARSDPLRNERSERGGGRRRQSDETYRSPRENRSDSGAARARVNSSRRRNGCPRQMRCSQKFWKRTPTRQGVYFEVCDYYRDRPNAEKMGEAIDKAEHLDPNDRRLKFYKGVLLVMQGKSPTEAEMLLKSYVATVPDNSDLPPHAAAVEWLGKLYESLGRSSEAAEEYRQSLTLDPHNKAVEEELKRVQKK